MLNDFITVKDAMLSGLIPDSYHSLFNNYVTCDDKYCGSPLIINRTRTVLKCSNPNCAKILASRVLKVYNRFGVMNFGPRNAYDWVTTSGIKTVPEALVHAPNSIKNNVLAWFNSYHSAGEILEVLAIPGIGTKAHKMMDGINNLQTLLQTIEFYGVQCVLLKCGFVGKLRWDWWVALKTARSQGLPWEEYVKYIIKNSSTGIVPYADYDMLDSAVLLEGLLRIFEIQLGGEGRDAQNCAELVYTYWDEIKLLFNLTKCLPGTVENRKIIITGDITQVTKEDGSTFERFEFIDYINSIALEGGIRYQNSTAFASSEFVIADYPSNTNKYQRGMEKGNLITSFEFLNIVKERVAEVRGK